MKNTCENCKFWDLENEKNVKNTTIRECKRVKMFWRCTEWSSNSYEYIHSLRTLKEENKNDKAFVQDASDFNAEFLTRKDFACNQFKPIE